MLPAEEMSDLVGGVVRIVAGPGPNSVGAAGAAGKTWRRSVSARGALTSNVLRNQGIGTIGVSQEHAACRSQPQPEQLSAEGLEHAQPERDIALRTQAFFVGLHILAVLGTPIHAGAEPSVEQQRIRRCQKFRQRIGAANPRFGLALLQ